MESYTEGPFVEDNRRKRFAGGQEEKVWSRERKMRCG